MNKNKALKISKKRKKNKKHIPLVDGKQKMEKKKNRFRN